MRRFAWQIGGVTVAIAAIVVLAVLAFGRGSSGAPVRADVHPSPSAWATPTADARVAAVEAAARRYVEALDRAMQTGSPQELDVLSVPGSQAEGNAGVEAHVVHDTGRAFVVTNLSVDSVNTDMAGTAVANVTISYKLTGYDATWPSLKPLGSARVIAAQKQLEIDFIGTQWLVATER